MGRITLGRAARFIVVFAVAIGLTVVVAGPASATTYTQTPNATTWSPMDGRVYAVQRIGNTIYIGGSFTTLRNPSGVGTVARSRLAAFDATTGALLPWNPGANNDVRALQPTLDGSGVIVGGLFTTLGGSAANRLGRVDSQTGARVSSFTAAANGAVYALARVGTEVIAGGGFSTYQGQARPRLAAFDEGTGAAVVGWSGSADSIVKSLLASPDGGRVIVGGQFHTLSGQSRDYIGAVNTSDGRATSWRPPAPCADVSRPCYVLDLAQDTGTVYAAVGGPGGRVVAYDVANGQRRWAAYADGDVQAIAVEDGVVYAGGHYGPMFSNSVRQGMVALDASTGGVLDFAPLFANGLKVWDILPGDDALRVGGGFTRIGTSSARQRYAEFPSVPDVPDSTPPSVPGGLHTTEVTDTIVSFAWSPSNDDNQVAGYRVWRDGQLLAPTGVTNYTDRDLQPSTTYTYQVQASDAAGNWSDLSDPLVVTTDPLSHSLVKVGSAWRYLSDGSNQGTAWRALGFNDSGWSVGNAQLGYGDSDESTVIAPLGLTSYFRQNFNVSDPTTISSLTLRLLRDDGAVVYINGTEVWRSNMPTGPITYQTPASSDVNGSAENTFNSQSIPVSVLNSGNNTIAVEVHNRTGSTDLSFDAELVPTF